MHPRLKLHPLSTAVPNDDTTIYFWNCSCDGFYIHPYTEATCPDCIDFRDDSPDAWVEEVALHAKEWMLDPDLVRKVELAYPEYFELSDNQTEEIFSHHSVTCDEMPDPLYHQFLLSLD